MTRRVDVFLPKTLPGGYLSPNRGERKEGRVPARISDAKRQLRGDVCLGLLAEDSVRALGAPMDPAHVVLSLRVMDGRKARQASVYRPEDAGNACYALKAAIDGLKDAGLIVDDDYVHVPLLTTSVERVESMADEGLQISVIELPPLPPLSLQGANDERDERNGL